MVPLSTPYDLVRERPFFFQAPKRPQLVDLPEEGYLVAAGQGAPGDEAFVQAVADLFNVAYTVKFALKKRGQDFKVPTFEGSWLIDSAAGVLPPAEWRWELLMMMPGFVTEEDVEAARASVAERKGVQPAVHLARITQGLCVQAMHVGPYDSETPTLDAMHAFMAQEGLLGRGPHHEVYIGNPQRAKPESLKTILRQPVGRI